MCAQDAARELGVAPPGSPAPLGREEGELATMVEARWRKWVHYDLIRSTVYLCGPNNQTETEAV